MSYPNKCCDLDSLPIVLLKACIDSTWYDNEYHKSLRTGAFPHDFEQAHVNPLLKKTTLPKGNFKNNLNYIYILKLVVLN